VFVKKIINYCKTSNKDCSIKTKSKKRTETIIRKKLNKLSINKLSKQILHEKVEKNNAERIIGGIIHYKCSNTYNVC